MTSFADIQALPPAHSLTWSASGIRLSRYWESTEGETIEFKRKGDYVDRFRELLRAAVDDRLRTDRVGVFMSGGLDSSAIAATASQLLSERHVRFDLRAHTVVYDHLIPHRDATIPAWSRRGLVSRSTTWWLMIIRFSSAGIARKCGVRNLAAILWPPSPSI